MGTPDAPDFSRVWELHNIGQTGGTQVADIDGLKAWALQTGQTEIVLGIVDTGIKYNPPNLQANMWPNTEEVPDDGNGFVDDGFGWDIATDGADPRNDTGHGAHVSSTIGALGNNHLGLVGVNWTVRPKGLKFLTARGSRATSGAVETLVHRTTNGVHILNNSWGGGGESRALRDAIAFARGFT